MSKGPAYNTAIVSSLSPSGAGNRPQVPFVYKLVLNRWLLSLFNAASWEQLAEHLRGEELERLDENNIHQFYHELILRFPNRPQLPADLLLEYDQNIFHHTQRLNERRIAHGEKPVVWKYFQYLTLLFTEVYLDRYFRNPQGLLTALNAQVVAVNADRLPADRISPFDEQAEAWPQLNKLAYWSATGSGKTLLMHANILQYQHYLQVHGRQDELNHVILLTPNEGLSLQHLREFEMAGIAAELFDKNGRGLFAGRMVEVIDIHKLKDEMGDKTVAVDAFEGNNLVLVDEGHRGASSGEEGAWMRFRNALCEQGFSFEYSATFGQAVKGDKALTDLYARSILVDYSYGHFYQDGFGKDYQILNLDEETEQNYLELYMVACLLAFFQQQRLYREREVDFRPFNIERPLWIFVGGSVTKTLAAREATDIVEILRFLARYLADRQGSIERIARILTEGLATSGGRNLFSGRFAYLNTTGLTPAQLFEETLATLFNAPGGGSLYVENLRGVSGEISLRVGDNEPFGVINVGDDSKLCKLCEKWPELTVREREFAGSLFHELGKPQSTIHLLIGAKKFTEGWNSWRVSTMGLMNVGRTEGAQIIQLFGRGVRLRGYNFGLKRSGKAQLPEGVTPPLHVGALETLNIFGIRANYMANFRDFLAEEGLPPDQVEFLLPVIKSLGTQKLKTVRLKKMIQGMSADELDAFRQIGPAPTLGLPGPYLQKNPVVLNWYPKIQAIKSAGLTGGDAESAPNQAYLTPGHVAFLDLDRLYFELERFKIERGWHNLNLTRESIASLLADQSWYRLLIPGEELAFDSFARVRQWQEIALSLLRKYVERYYAYCRHEWELPHLEYRDLTGDDPNLLGVREAPGDSYYYRVLIEESQAEVIEKLKELRAQIERGELKPWEFSGIKTVWFQQHLYQPLLYLDQDTATVSPAPLNKGEWQFVLDLKAFYEGDKGYFADKELYLLRNLTRGRGVGFFEAGNFYPDFILWLLTGGKQHVVFIDPKGVRNLEWNDPKIEFYEKIRDIGKRLRDDAIRLHSFIISNTPSHIVTKKWHMDKPAVIALHVLFQNEDKDDYIRSMLEAVVSSL